MYQLVIEWGEKYLSLFFSPFPLSLSLFLSHNTIYMYITGHISLYLEEVS